jgi:VWFA-related protein
LDALQAGGGTALFDAVLAGLVLSSSSSARPVLLLLSDGRDTASWLSEPELIAAARLSETPVYAVSTWPIGALAVPTGGRQTWASVASQSDDAFLRRLARETGGRVFRANSVSSLRKQLAAVLEEIGQRYLIGYTPQGTDAGEWHKVDVRLRRKRATILARPGYSRPARAGGGS